MRLYVGVFGAEEGGGPLDGDALGGVRLVAAAVVAVAGVALGVLVGQGRAEGGEDGGRGEVLGGRELEGAGLPVQLAQQDAGDLRVLAEQGAEVLRQAAVGGGCGGSVDRHRRLRARGDWRSSNVGP